MNGKKRIAVFACTVLLMLGLALIITHVMYKEDDENDKTGQKPHKEVLHQMPLL